MPTDALLPRAARLGAASQAARPNPGWMAGGAAPRRQPRRPSKTARARDEHAVHLRARRLRRSQGLASTGVCRLFSASRFYIRAVDVSAQTNRESRALESVRPATGPRLSGCLAVWACALWRPPWRRGLEPRGSKPTLECLEPPATHNAPNRSKRSAVTITLGSKAEGMYYPRDRPHATRIDACALAEVGVCVYARRASAALGLSPRPRRPPAAAAPAAPPLALRHALHVIQADVHLLDRHHLGHRRL